MTSLLLVDSASLYFRAFFGIPTAAARSPDGMPVNAARGFLDMLATLIRTRGPGRMVCALDEDWRPAWRVALIPTYKTHRVLVPHEAAADEEVVPDELSPQVPIILELLDAFGIAAVGAAEHEADDVIGTLAARGPAPVEVATGDRDLFQVVDDERDVRVLYLAGRSGLANLVVMNDDAVRARYGVPAGEYAAFAALRGDPSDGLPGVPGIGEKSAAKLIAAHGSIPALIEALGNGDKTIPAGLRVKLDAARAYLAVAPKVVEVARDVTLPAFDPTLPTAPRDADRLAALAQRWNLDGPVRRLTDALAGAGGGAGGRDRDGGGQATLA